MIRRSFLLLASQHAPALLRPTAPCLSPDWLKAERRKNHERNQRRALERQGINVEEDDDGLPWVDPEEQARLDAEKAAQEAKRREREDELAKARLAEDSDRRDKQKRFRAAQLEKSRKSRDSVAEAKQARKAAAQQQEADGDSRTFVEEVDEPVAVAAPQPQHQPPSGGDAAAQPGAAAAPKDKPEGGAP